MLLLLICTCTYVRHWRSNWIHRHSTGLQGVLYKFTVLGFRCSYVVSPACLVMAFYLLFIQ